MNRPGAACGRRTDRGDPGPRQVVTGGRGHSGAKPDGLADHHPAEVARGSENDCAAISLAAAQLTHHGAEQQPSVADWYGAFGGRDGHLHAGAKCRDDRVVSDCVGAQRDREPETRTDDARGGQADADRPHPGPLRASTPQQRAEHTADRTERPDDVPDRPQDSRGRHHPTGHRRGHQTRIQPRRRWVGAGWLRHLPQTRTSGRSFSSRPGPMPSTSPSWSTLVNFPLAFRQATIAAARTGPTPGRVSNCSTVAVLRLISAVGAPLAGRGLELDGSGAAEPGLTELPRTAGCPFTGAIPTTICSPSSTCRAMLSPLVSAPSVLPPAAFSASAMRAPGASVTRPGVCTRPTTLTTSGWLGRVEGPALGPRLAVAAMSTGGSLADITGAGCSRIRVKTVTSTAIAAIAAKAIAPARPGSARTLASQPPSCCVEPSGTQRGNSELGSVSASLSSSSRSDGAAASGRAPSRRCNRSAGSSVRMGRR